MPNTDRWWTDPKTGIYYLEIYVDQKRSRLSTGETDFELAQKGRRDLERKAKDRHGKRRQKNRATFESKWDAWMELRKPEWSDKTYRCVKSAGNVHFKPFFGEYLLDELSGNAGVTAWENYISAKLRGNSSMKLAKHQDYLMMFFKFQHRAGELVLLPILRNPDDETDSAVVITPEQEAAIIRWATSNAKDDLLLGFRIAIDTGMRENEVFWLRKDQVDTREWVIRIKVGDTKTRQWRVVPLMNPWIREELERRIAAAGSDYIFPSPRVEGEPRDLPRWHWDEVRAATGIDITFHNTRHTCASRMGEAGVPPAVGARILGMSIEVFDRKYCRIKESDLKKHMASFYERSN